jgi:hypothetical protein
MFLRLCVRAPRMWMVEAIRALRAAREAAAEVGRRLEGTASGTDSGSGAGKVSGLDMRGKAIKRATGHHTTTGLLRPPPRITHPEASGNRPKLQFTWILKLMGSGLFKMLDAL